MPDDDKPSPRRGVPRAVIAGAVLVLLLVVGGTFVLIVLLMGDGSDEDGTAPAPGLQHLDAVASMSTRA